MKVTILEVPSNEIKQDDIISFDGNFYQIVSEPLWGEAYYHWMVTEVAVSANGDVMTLSNVITILQVPKRKWRSNNTAYFCTYLKVEFTE